MSEVRITEDRGERVFLHGTTAHDKASALRIVSDLFDQAEKLEVPSGHAVIEVTISPVVTATIAPHKVSDNVKITPQQFDYLSNLAENTSIKPDLWARDVFDCGVRQLTKTQAYVLIAAMEKVAKIGQFKVAGS